MENEKIAKTGRTPKNFLINWVGGKRLLRKVIEPLIPKDIATYIEPFGGGAWVLFYKEKWAGTEVYNDLDGRLANLFKMVKFHPDALKKELQYMLASREFFMQYLQIKPITEIQRAAHFMFLITRSFGGRGATFGTVKTSSGGATKSHKNILTRIDAIHERLDRVLIENRDFEKLLTQYDHEGAFFYCDPPYTCGCGYDVTSTEDFAHERLRDVLKNIKGRFLLSYDDSPKVRELYKDFPMIAVERLNGINNKSPDGGRKNKMFKELLIANYDIKKLHNA